MAIKHKIRTKTGKPKIVELTARRAIIEQCKECFGWETNPRECSDSLCSLYPFRTWDTPKDTVIFDNRGLGGVNLKTLLRKGG